METETVISTGCSGLDSVLNGGFSPGYMYFIQGQPGTGKTTLAFQFLLDGVQRQESCMYVGPAGGIKELRKIADSHGWSLDSRFLFQHEIDIALNIEGAKLQIFHPSETELWEAINSIYRSVGQMHPRRIVVDCMAELRFLAQDPLTYRRSMLDMKKRLTEEEATVLFVESGSSADEAQLEAIAHGTIMLERAVHGFGPVRRQLQVTKYRGKKFHGGWHDIDIKTGGVVVFQTLIAAEHRKDYERSLVSSGNEAIDKMLGGGLLRGTNLAILGPSGSGKSTLASQFAVAAARRGERVIVYTFEETTESFIQRSDGIGLGLSEVIQKGHVQLVQIDVATMSPGEFVFRTLQEVEKGDVSMIVIDSINGYINSMPDEKYLIIHLHEILMSFSQMGVTSILTVAQHGVLIAEMQEDLNVTYLADSAILIRFFEMTGEVHRSVSVVKQRMGRHETNIRELDFGEGIAVSEPLRNMHGVLTGLPTFIEDEWKNGKRP